MSIEQVEACTLPHRQPINIDNHPTATSVSQEETEKLVAECLFEYRKMQTYQYKDAKLYKREHEKFLVNSRKALPKEMKALDASKPWLCYYIVNSLDLLWNDNFEDEKKHKNDLMNSMANDMEAFLCECCQNSMKFNPKNCFPTQFSCNASNQHPTNPDLCLNPCDVGEGGFGGGPFQTSHLCATYAAVNGLSVLEKYSKIDRLQMYNYLISLKDPTTGAFHMHKSGEIDVRGCYCALSVASMLGILTEELVAGVPEFIVSCQSPFDGGISAYPGQEAHGGYTFCGIASMLLLNKSHWLDLTALQNWIVKRQMSFEGGFQGRTNKLVDACYSFWVGSCVPMVQAALIIMNLKEKIEQNEEEFWKKQLNQLEFALLFDNLNINPEFVWKNDSNLPDRKKSPIAFENYQKNLKMRKYFDISQIFPNFLQDLTLFPPKEEENQENEKEKQETDISEDEDEEDEELDLDLTKQKIEDLHPEIKNKGLLWMDQNALQEYVLLCCQNPLSGGLKDKPGVNRDIYHTNYALCGLSVAQNNPVGQPSVLGLRSNKLTALNPLHGVCVEKAKKIVKFFGKNYANAAGDVPD